MYKIQLLFIYGWDNFGEDTYKTIKEARAEIKDVLNSGLDYVKSELRIVEV